NIQRQLDVAVSLNKLGDAKLDGVDTWGAITCYEASVTIWRRLLGREPSNVCWHSNLAQIQEKIGDLRFAAGDKKGALTPYEEMLAADRELVEIDGSNIEWQWNLSIVSLDKGTTTPEHKDHQAQQSRRAYVCRVLGAGTAPNVAGKDTAPKPWASRAT